MPQAGKSDSANIAWAWPSWSMANPATSGPIEFEIEKPSASHEKFTARSSGVPCAPNTLFIAMWMYMNEVPTNVHEKYSVTRCG
jgi:hypothetical protein